MIQQYSLFGDLVCTSEKYNKYSEAYDNLVSSLDHLDIDTETFLETYYHIGQQLTTLKELVEKSLED